MQLVAWVKVLDQMQLRGLRSGQPAALQQQLDCGCGSHGAGQALRAGGARQNRQAGFGQADQGVIGHGPDVTGQGEDRPHP
jgi:hypothetical protein